MKTLRAAALITVALALAGCESIGYVPLDPETGNLLSDAPQAMVATAEVQEPVKAKAKAPRGLFAALTASKTERQEDLQRAALKDAVAEAARIAPSRGRIWCVPFARDASGVEIRGNAHTWWAKAAGEYERGNDPAIGAVMSFASSRKMPLGHVAVVSDIVDERTVKLDHANWSRNKISYDQIAIDVSKANDWSQVRLVSGSAPGRINPVNGFIYGDLSVN